MPFGRDMCPSGTRKVRSGRDLYHIATERSEVISHLSEAKIYRTEQREVYRLKKISITIYVQRYKFPQGIYIISQPNNVRLYRI